jgi:hydrogenase nickel incorporation protein HypB
MIGIGNHILAYRHHGHFNKPHSHPESYIGPEVGGNLSGTRKIKIVRRILDVNGKMAEQNRRFFSDKNVFVLNLMSSPGSGKTATLEKTLTRLGPKIRCAVIVGDICTTNDADRLALTGVPVVQINTNEFGGDCHLTAHVIKKAALNIDMDAVDLLFVENVGNLVCPAEFDIGEDSRVVILSTTEGEDKPLKYPLMFRECDVALLNKIDLIPHLDFNRQAAIENIKQIHSNMPVFELSAKTEEGFEHWINWVQLAVRQKQKTAASLPIPKL